MNTNAKKIILFLCAAVCLAFIWLNSFMPGNISGSLSAYAEKILKMFFGEDFPVTESMLRKLMHGLEFAVLGIICSLGFSDKLPAKLPSAELCGLVTALIDETIQLFSDGRASSVKDVWIDFGGFSAGVLLVMLLLMLLQGGRKKNEHEH